MTTKTNYRWPDAHIRLRKLYDQRVPKGMSQEEFGATYGIGTQGMVWQLLTGHRPLSFESAAKFAKGLRCTIADISPEMADELKRDILPVIGPRAWLKAAAKAAMLALLVIPPLVPNKAEAAFNINTALIHIVRLRLVYKALFLCATALIKRARLLQTA